MNKWLYSIFFLLATALPYTAWACVEEELPCADECGFFFEEDDTPVIHYDDCAEDACPCDVDPGEEENSAVPEETGLFIKRSWQQILFFSINIVVYNRSFSHPVKHTFSTAFIQYPPKPAYYNFIFRYSPF